MTSTNFNVGMADSTRNSSRVLKPPGGGHSDIFGLHEPQEQCTTKAKNYQKSSISQVFGTSEAVTNANGNNNQKEIKKTEEAQIVTVTDNKVSNENEAPKQPMTTPQRTRVPPGGFSSGLW